MTELINFKGMNSSFSKDLNLLQKEKNIYIMDNHNAALWCWIQEIDLEKKYNIIHIDAHYDAAANHLDNWISNIPKNLKELSIEEYLDLRFTDPNSKNTDKVMRWDNYFPIFHRLYNKNIAKYYFFTQNKVTLYDGMKSMVEEYSIIGLLNLLDYLFTEENSNKQKWIVNIDLDYFFIHPDNSLNTFRFISLSAIEHIFTTLKKYLNKRITVMTIALSPECCGGWDNSIELLKYVSKILKIDFKQRIPNQL